MGAASPDPAPSSSHSFKRDAFSGCHRHGQFDYYCHSCLVATVATLCGMLDSRPDNTDSSVSQ